MNALLRELLATAILSYGRAVWCSVWFRVVV